MPFDPFWFWMKTSCSTSERPDVMRMPLRPASDPPPSMVIPRSKTSIVPGVAVAESFTLTPLVPELRMLPSVPVQSMVIDLVIVTAPNPPGSKQLISPLFAVLLIAPANVLQGAVRLQGLASSPTPETHVRVACPNDGAA